MTAAEILCFSLTDCYYLFQRVTSVTCFEKIIPSLNSDGILYGNMININKHITDIILITNSLLRCNFKILFWIFIVNRILLNVENFKF